MLQQKHTDPYLAIVIDPTRTMSAGKVEIGCFRTFPEDYKSNMGSDFEHVPLEKIEVILSFFLI